MNLYSVSVISRDFVNSRRECSAAEDERSEIHTGCVRRGSSDPPRSRTRANSNAKHNLYMYVLRTCTRNYIIFVTFAFERQVYK